MNNEIVEQARRTIRESQRIRRDANSGLQELQTAVNRAHDIRRRLATAPDPSEEAFVGQQPPEKRDSR